jgi:hypothetical protein
MKYDYYYNKLPGEEPWRNNLIYTSLMSEDKKVFVQWYYNDEVYHRGQNQVVLPELMQEKWEREIKYAQLMNEAYPDLVPKIIDIDHTNRKLYLEVDGDDFWQRSHELDSYYDVLPDWDTQMIDIIKAHKSLNLHKYSMHPSSYFVVDGRLKSINYFFTYHKNEPHVSIQEVESHIYSTRQDEMRNHIESLGIEWDKPQPFPLLDKLCWESFRKNYPDEFIDRIQCLT